jgi:hypothetical protein
MGVGGNTGVRIAGFEGMKSIQACVYGVICGVAIAAIAADETLPYLKSGDNVYSNVTITSVTATDIYFSYRGGMGNAKLKNLSPELQKHFHFDADKAGDVEKQQSDATAQFKKNVLVQAQKSKRLAAPTYEDGDLVVPEIFAHSFRGQHPPAVIVDHWLTSPPPDPSGKFVLVFFWLTSAEQCRNAIPHINDLARLFNDRMIVMGVSNEPVEEMEKRKVPVNFYVGTDTQSRSMRAFEVTALPHAVLIDPSGIVRFEGPPIYLNEKDVLHFLETYGK